MDVSVGGGIQRGPVSCGFVGGRNEHVDPVTGYFILVKDLEGLIAERGGAAIAGNGDDPVCRRGGSAGLALGWHPLAAVAKFRKGRRQ